MPVQIAQLVVQVQHRTNVKRFDFALSPITEARVLRRLSQGIETFYRRLLTKP